MKYLTTWLFVFSMCSVAADLKNGDFASEEYLQTLTSTRSPAKAAKSRMPQLIIIRVDTGGTTLKTIYEFNEGGPVFKIGKSGFLNLVEGVGSHPEFHGIDSTHFAFSFDGHSKTNFRSVVDVQSFAEKTCLEGRYVGTKNERVEFSDQKEFIFNASKRKFTIGLFYPPSFELDYFISDSTEYGFSRKGDTLKIYEVTDGSLFVDGKMSRVPTMILIRKKE
ncbi:MAG: hypothetical protein ABIW76_22380 [Fibrobacteria bacterium]